MDKQYSWKKTEDMEVDLAELAIRLCRKWKQAAACALVFAFVLGGYGWAKGGNAANTVQPDMEAVDELMQAEEQGVTDAVQLTQEIESLETYLDGSILMQVDPYHKDKCIILYRIGQAKWQELPSIMESYLNYIVNGGAVDALKKSGSSAWKMDKAYGAELVTAYQKTYSQPYQVVVEESADSSIPSDAIFYVEITAKSAVEAEKMAKDMQKVLKAYSVEVSKKAGSHTLTLVSMEQSITIDSGLQTQQHDKKTLLSSNQANLKAMTDAFSKGQMALYKNMIGTEGEEEDEAEITGPAGKSVTVKYLCFGLLGGLLFYCGIFSCCYLFSDKVKSIRELDGLYTFPFYGGIFLKGRSQKQRAKRVEIQPEILEGGKTQVMERIRLVCSRQGITKLCAVSDVPLDTQEKGCLETIAHQMRGWGIELAIVENMGVDTARWEELADTGNVLMVCKIGVTTHRMIDYVMGFYQENGISVIGATAFYQKN